MSAVRLFRRKSEAVLCTAHRKSVKIVNGLAMERGWWYRMASGTTMISTVEDPAASRRAEQSNPNVGMVTAAVFEFKQRCEKPSVKTFVCLSSKTEFGPVPWMSERLKALNDGEKKERNRHMHSHVVVRRAKDAKP